VQLVAPFDVVKHFHHKKRNQQNPQNRDLIAVVMLSPAVLWRGQNVNLPLFRYINHQNQIVPNPPHIAAPAKFTRAQLHSQAPKNEPVVTTQSRIK